MSTGDGTPDILRYVKCCSAPFAAFGTDLAEHECYEDAIYFLSIAIQYQRNDYRLYFNRAFCLLELDRNEDALKDIEICISLKKDWTNALFKKGQILANMNRFVEAQKTFKNAWRMQQGDCDEIRKQITGSSYQALRQQGFDPIQAGYGAMFYLDIEEAADALKAGALESWLYQWRTAKKKKYFNKKNRPLTPITYY
ncbi:tetratricopeptide repeat protein 31-like protein [Leptotrombidium deliense]|uniref:Tetratricopeptide repeat protein 31-like protein n=1 Tax=Leptotrombidium deliense TaxID=299467 RepID=A0A443SPB3_9ACAR|nr:tetratricopeptide repeat protein 31-like protein [Leptotrombidium deliense]